MSAKPAKKSGPFEQDNMTEAISASSSFKPQTKRSTNETIAPSTALGIDWRMGQFANKPMQSRIIRVIEAVIPESTELKRVAVYARVSMESELLIHSFSAQVDYYSKFIQKTPGWKCAGIFADKGISGTSTNRVEFKRLLAECEAGRIDIILTKSISRFASNTVDLLVTIRRLKELGIDVHFEKERINTLSRDGELLLTILASFAQAESHSTSENCKWSIRSRYAAGKPRVQAMYGYRVVDGELIIEESEAQVVRRIFQMCLEGSSCYAIAKKLTVEGLRSFRGTIFYGCTIAYMLRQEKYTGSTLCQKYYVRDHITHKEMRNNGEMPMYFIEGTHPAIISSETFQAVQRKLAQKNGVEIQNGIAGWGKSIRKDVADSKGTTSRGN